MRLLIMLLAAIAVLTPAQANWVAANPQVQEAAKDPQIAGALAAATALDSAILAKDATAFASLFADDAVVNNPYLRISRKADAVRNMQTGLIDYASLERHIEYAARRGEHEVILMGEEWLRPLNDARDAGKTAKRRTTELWTNVEGRWQLVLRQATVYEAR